MNYIKKYLALFSVIILSSCGNDEKVLTQNTETISQNYLIETETQTTSETTQENTNLNISQDETLIIGEKMFITQIEEIYYNFEHYKDKKIVVEGMYTLFYDENGVKNKPVVYRNAPGCCGNDGWAGFYLNYDGEYPEDNDWIKVTGTLELIQLGNFFDLCLNVEKIEVLEQRGEEFVIQ